MLCPAGSPVSPVPSVSASESINVTSRGVEGTSSVQSERGNSIRPAVSISTPLFASLIVVESESRTRTLHSPTIASTSMTIRSSVPPAVKSKPVSLGSPKRAGWRYCTLKNAVESGASVALRASGPGVEGSSRTASVPSWRNASLNRVPPSTGRLSCRSEGSGGLPGVVSTRENGPLSKSSITRTALLAVGRAAAAARARESPMRGPHGR